MQARRYATQPRRSTSRPEVRGFTNTTLRGASSITEALISVTPRPCARFRQTVLPVACSSILGSMETPFLGNRRSHMSTSNTSKHPSQRRYPPELRQRAVRMVREAIAEDGESFGVVTRVGRQLGIGVESLRNWVKQAEVDDGRRPGTTTEERRRIAELERENRELRRANEILKAAASFFARELDPRLPK